MPSKIEWLRGPDNKPGETWNPLGWGCYGPTGTAENPQPCPYCFAKRMANRKLRKCALCQAFIPHWHPEVLERPLHWKQPRRIFVASMSDLFGDWISQDQFQAIMGVIGAANWHTFYLLTKQPQNIPAKIATTKAYYDHSPDDSGFCFYRNLWIGVSVTCAADLPRIAMLRDAWPGHKFVSMEPLLNMAVFPDLGGMEWAIIGAMTGAGAKKHQPKYADVLRIIDGADCRGIPVFLKDSLTSMMPCAILRQEWPKEIAQCQQKDISYQKTPSGELVPH